MYQSFISLIYFQKLPENDLLGEFNFWKRQKLVLSTCYDHLNKPSIQQTLEILKIADSDLSEFEKKMAEVEKHLKVASDNFNYLSLLEPLRKVTFLSVDFILVLLNVGTYLCLFYCLTKKKKNFVIAFFIQIFTRIRNSK